jgi:hypothetical protein
VGREVLLLRHAKLIRITFHIHITNLVAADTFLRRSSRSFVFKIYLGLSRFLCVVSLFCFGVKAKEEEHDNNFYLCFQHVGFGAEHF